MGSDNAVLFYLLPITNTIKIGNLIWTPGIAINSTAKAPCVYNVKRDDSTIQQHNTWVINMQKKTPPVLCDSSYLQIELIVQNIQTYQHTVVKKVERNNRC